MSVVRRAVVFADYYQFYVQDYEAHDRDMQAGAAMDPHRPPAGWGPDSERTRIGVEPYSISVSTARRDRVEMSFQLHVSPPKLVNDTSHVVEADLDIPSGLVSIFGCLETPTPSDQVPVEPGRYRVRVSYAPASVPPADASPHELGDHLVYRVDMWPSTTPAPVVIIQQGNPKW